MITYSAAADEIRISGSETWETLRTYLDANPQYKVSTNNYSIEPSKYIYLLAGSTLTISGKCLVMQTTKNDGYSPLRTSQTLNQRGTLVLRNSAQFRITGSQTVYSESHPNSDYKDSEIILDMGDTGVTGSWFSGQGVVSMENVRLTTVGRMVIDQHIASVGSNPFVKNVRLNNNSPSGVGYLLLHTMPTDGLFLEQGLSVSGGFATSPAQYHKNMTVIGATDILQVYARRGRASHVFYNLNNGTSRIWKHNFISTGSGGTPALASRYAHVWKFQPTIQNSNGTKLQGIRWAVNTDSASPFTYNRTGLTTSNGVVSYDDGRIFWGENAGAGLGRYFYETDSALIIKGQTPENTLANNTLSLLCSAFNIKFRSYTHLSQATSGYSGDSDFISPVIMLEDTGLSYTENEASTINIATINWTAKTINITAPCTLDQLYAQMKYAYTRDTGITYEDSFVTAGQRLDISNWTISNESNLTPGIRLSAYTDITGTTCFIAISNLVSNSRVRINNETDNIELYNEVVTGTSLYVPIFFTEDKDLSVRITNVSGVTAYLPYESIGRLTSSGSSFTVSQSPDLVYNENAIDGSLVTEFIADYPNIEVDINDGDGITSVKRLYAAFQYMTAGSQGIIYFFGGITAQDTLNYQINTNVVDLKIDNTSSSPVIISDAYLFRDDGTSIIAASSNSIQMNPSRAYGVNAGLTKAQDEKLMNMVSGGGSGNITSGISSIKTILARKIEEEHEKTREMITKGNNETNSQINIVKTEVIDTIKAIPEADLSKVTESLGTLKATLTKLSQFVRNEAEKEKNEEKKKMSEEYESRLSELLDKIEEMEDAYEELDGSIADREKLIEEMESTAQEIMEELEKEKENARVEGEKEIKEKLISSLSE